MALVNYGSSDSESSDVESNVPTPALAKKTAQNSSNGSLLGSLLPPPRNNASISKPKKTPQSTPSRPVIYVDLPKAHEADDVDEEEDKKRSKRQKTAGSGSFDLADLLPAPKRGYSLTRPKPAATTLKVPVAASAPKAAAAKASTNVVTPQPSSEPRAQTDNKKKPLAEKEVEEEEEEEEPIQHSGPFFRLGAELKPHSSYGIGTVKKKSATFAAAKPEQPRLLQEESPKQEQQQQQQQQEQQQQQHYITAADAYAYNNTDVNAMYSYDPAQYYQYWQQYQQQEQGSIDTTTQVSESPADPFADMDDATYTRLTGKRKQRESNVRIKSVSQEDILPDPEWHERNKQLQAPKFVSSAAAFEASGLQRKKNNIMALAAQAQSMQERLNEQFASSRTTMQESRKKYGF